MGYSREVDGEQLSVASGSIGLDFMVFRCFASNLSMSMCLYIQQQPCKCLQGLCKPSGKCARGCWRVLATRWQLIRGYWHCLADSSYVSNSCQYLPCNICPRVSNLWSRWQRIMDSRILEATIRWLASVLACWRQRRADCRNLRRLRSSLAPVRAAMATAEYNGDRKTTGACLSASFLWAAWWNRPSYSAAF